MEDKMKIWNKLKKPPSTALKSIQAGRLKGMTDIKPQWRYEALTECFGPCGKGWKYIITDVKTFDGSEGQIAAIVCIDFFYAREVLAHETIWSDAIPGIGGSMLVAKESRGPHTSDEAFKMALTDALSYAASKIGVAAEVYMGNWNGSKYINQTEQKKEKRDWIKEIESAKDENTLRAMFAAAYHSTDGEEKAKVKMAYDKKKQEFKGE